MTEYVLVSDIHGNYPALQAVVDKEGKDKNYLVLGDLMGLNSYPKQTLDLVREIGDVVLAGNHDKAIFQYKEGHVNSEALSKFEVTHTLDSLTQEDIDWANSLPHLEVIEKHGKRICLTHALPWPDMASGYEMGNSGITKGQVPHIASVVSDDYDYVFHGHTHTQYSLDCEQFGHNVHFVNPGSLGYNDMYAIVDTETGDVELKTIEYDVDVAEHISDVLPDYAPSVSTWY